MSYSVNIKGYNEIQAKLRGMPDRLTKEISATIEAGVKTFVSLAKRAAPKDFGQLAGSIGYEKTAPLGWSVFANKEYAPYVEWGTITRVSVPGELQPYAIQFKGRGIRKTGGLYPRPYFFPQLPIAKKQIEVGLQTIVKTEKL